MNSVPAAAVIRGGLALFEMIGRKGHVGCQSSSCDKIIIRVIIFVKSLSFLSGRALVSNKRN